MVTRLLVLLLLTTACFSCRRQTEEVPIDHGFDYQPLEVGLYRIYEVDQTLYSGENDSEQSYFYYKDEIKSFYVNKAGEQVYIVTRSRSGDQSDWQEEMQFSLLLRNYSLIQTMDNQPVVSLVFPPSVGTSWDGNSYRSLGEDEFSLISGSVNVVTVVQEESDDQITYRDIRYEIFTRGVGMTEKYDEVLTYCSRNDCLGDQLIDSGSKTHMKMTGYGKN